MCHDRRIRRISVEGARRTTEDDVLETIQLRQGAPCTDREVAADAQALWNQGFYDDIIFEAAEVREGVVDIFITVRERRAIGRVVFEGHDAVEEEDLDEKVNLREGEVLSLPDVVEQVTRIRDLYAEKGFFLARIRYELSELPNNEVEVKYIIDEGDEVAVRRIRFTGNHSISGDELRGFMRTSETGFFSFISDDDAFNPEFFEEDVQRLQAVYYDRGYLSISVGTPRIELTPVRSHIDVTIPLEEGPRFRIGRMRISELDGDGEEVEPLGGRRALREQIDANPGDWFSRSTIAANLLEVTRYYRDRGYALVEMVPQTDLDMNRRRVNVIISIRRGPPVRIERINIRGNSKTRDQVLRREITIVEGDLYNMTEVERSKARITALGYFERVDVSEEEGSSPERIVLNFEVAEKSTGTFQIGAGFSSIESFIFTAQVQQQNLFGRGQSLSLQLQLSGIRQLAQVRFTEPYLWGSQWSGSVDVFKTIRQFVDFNRDSTGGSLSIGHPLFIDQLRFFLRYRAEYVDISSRTGGLFGAGGGGRGFDIFQRVPLQNLFLDGLTSSVQASVTYDTRNNRIFPTGGIYASYSLEVADKFFGSENVFLRHRAFARFYRQFFGLLTLKLNTEWGLITSRLPEGVPIYERFYLGGIFSVRGFNLNSLGPRLGIPRSYDPNASVPADGVVIGGNMQFFYNLELEFNIIEAVGIRGVIFTDGGNAWNTEQQLCNAPPSPLGDDTTSSCSVNPLGIRTSWGFGIRWISPLGPLRFEWGIPFARRPNERDMVFEFTIGNFF
ncbi:MAG: outer membrane protein assembly factor BamA [Deltaproteobacteria bacterium]|nr:MAG: outer membrane protein assembly factor BamA [Deltaproteobacteria bacterium]